MLQTLFYPLAFIVLLIGISHGSLDDLLARQAGLLESKADHLLFYVGYIFLTIMVLAVWIHFPIISLIIFLLISAQHFSQDHNESTIELRFGLIILAGPAWFHPTSTSEIFSLLLLGLPAELFVQALKLFGAISIILCLGSISQINNKSLLELLIIVTIGYFLHPLLYFGIYFTFFHSLHHFQWAFGELIKSSTSIIIKRVLLNTLLAFILLFIYFSTIEGDTFENNVTQTIFIGLAALTVPHMATLYLIKRRRAF